MQHRAPHKLEHSAADRLPRGQQKHQSALTRTGPTTWAGRVASISCSALQPSGREHGRPLEPRASMQVLAVPLQPYLQQTRTCRCADRPAPRLSAGVWVLSTCHRPWCQSFCYNNFKWPLSRHWGKSRGETSTEAWANRSTESPGSLSELNTRQVEPCIKVSCPHHRHHHHRLTSSSKPMGIL